MGHFHIDLIHFSIVEGGVDFDMTENALDLFYRHSFIYCHSGESTTKFVRMYLVHSNALADCTESDFNSADCQSVVGFG